MISRMKSAAFPSPQNRGGRKSPRAHAAINPLSTMDGTQVAFSLHLETVPISVFPPSI
jgi:hypothetical protein